MSEFFKNKRGAILALGAFFLAVTLLAGSVAYLFQGADLVAEAKEQGSVSEDGGPEEPAGPEGDEPTEPDGGEEDKPSEEEEEEEPVHYNKPGEMRGVFLTPGTDFITSQDTSESTVRAEIDKALSDAKNLTMNAVIIDTVYADQVIYQTSGSPELSPDFDIMDYTVKRAREENMYTYAIFDASFYRGGASGVSLLAVGAGSSDALSANLREFAEKYPVDGILIDGYINAQTPQSYSVYTLAGGAMGYDNFMRQSPTAVMRTASRVLRKYAKGVQVGLLADAVWENDAVNGEGSATKASFTALGDGNADTKAFLTEGLVDFVAVKAYSSTTDAAVPFGEVVKWWSGVAKEAGVPMYAVHASGKICTEEPGWQAQDQLVRQLIEANEISGFGGSIFNNLKRLVEDPKSAATTMIRYYNQEVEAEHILTELAVTKPEMTSFTTSEPVVTFTGASDPNFPVTINGEAVATDASGYFTVAMELQGGENTFTISHKEKSINYTIVREIEILKDITPQGSIAAEGGMSIGITALAYEEAEVYAVVNGTTVKMTIDEDAVVDESGRDSSYKKFSGQYSAPAATGEEQNLGNIVVYATWKGQEKSIQGASVKVNKKAKIEDGVPVVVVADQAMTYPYNTLDNIPNAAYYPLPQGAMDYAVGDEIVYKKGSNTYTYYVLASKLRVESGDISPSSDYAGGNAVNGMTVHSEGGYTYVTLKTAQKVSFSFAYSSDGVEIQLHNTTKSPGSAKVDDNAVFKDAQWTGDGALSLSFIKSGGFMGYKAYYEDNGDLMFRFNNPPASVSGARIAIDPGHGGKDVGALGFLADYPEKTINLAIAQLLADELTDRGANVLLLDTTGGMDLKERARQAEKFGADLFVSVHNNTAPNSNATGTEVYYFYPYAKTLAANAAANVSGQLGTNNRGAKQSYYHVTLSSQVPSILVECGFMTNKAEYEKLIKSKNQAKIASGIADAIAASIKSAATGYKEAASGAADDTAPKDDTSSKQDEDERDTDDTPTSLPDTDSGGSSQSDSGAVAVEDVSLSLDEHTMEVGESVTLKASFYPVSASNKNVTWKSGNSAVATVSSSGKVKAVAEGRAKITVTTEDGGKTAECQITVVAAGSGEDPTFIDESDFEELDSKQLAKAEDIEMKEEKVTVGVGASQKLSLVTYPASAGTSNVSWWSSDEDIATVDSSGKVTGLMEGKCNIVASLDGTDIEVACTLEVESKDAIAASGSVKLSQIDDIWFEYDSSTMYIGTKQTMVLMSDKGAVNNSQLKWESSNTSVAKVSSSGVVEARSKTGTAKISAYTDDDEFYASCTITVTDKKVSVTSISLNKSDIIVVKGAAYKELKATLYPSNATNKGLKWTTENKRVATVDQNGVVTGVNRGTTVITATSEDGKHKATCNVEVVKEVEIDGIELDMNSLELWVGDEEALEVYFYPDGISSVPVKWTSDASRIVSVDGSGNVKALREGIAVIRVQVADDPDIWDECVIRVIK